jgi:3-dehydroquinate synthase
MSVTSALKTYYINLDAHRKFPIIFGEQAHTLIDPKEYAGATKAMIVTNKTVAEACSGLIQALEDHLECEVVTYVIEDGESFKQLQTLEQIIDACIHNSLGRKDLVLAVGGGVVGDITGFAASVYLRGISFIQVPTSLLAQVDAAIGGKTGVNHEQGKNLIGTFYQPIKTIIDPTVLASLSPEEMKQGLAEVIKYGVINDKPLFWYIEQHAAAIQTFNYNNCPDVWNYLIEKSIQNKALVVSQDEKEAEVREILNFGHTIGHAIESVFKYNKVSHGDAVAMGMVVESVLSNQLKYLSNENLERIQSVVGLFDYPFIQESLDKDLFFSALKLDKKTRKGKVRFVLPTDIGSTKTVEGIQDEEIITAMKTVFGEAIL